jgi:DNA polymerase-2
MIQRNRAIKEKDKSLSQAIKILMNSFYGVMGSYGCRFYHPDLPSAITSTGKWLLLGSKEYLEKLGYEVIYGDTDSLFVKLKGEEGAEAHLHGNHIADELNVFWKRKLHTDFKVESCLELEYEKYYKKFILTQSRGGETGAKKRYAGLILKDGKEILEFVGMEYVRSDWTRLAKEFQVELYERIFSKKEINNWMNFFIDQVYRGEFDDKLIYKKRLRKDVDDYIKNVPPQVRAAKMLSGTTGTVNYVITRRGPVPVELKPQDIDYRHYIEKQLKPIADSILQLMGKNFESIVKTGQLNIFEN